MNTTLAVDLGGTNTRVALVDAAGTVLRRAVFDTPVADPTPERLTDTLRSFVDAAEARVVVGVPGRVDHARNALDHAPNLPAAWRPHLSGAALARAIGRPCALVNDADLAALGESRFGAGRGVSSMVYLTVSTGIGAGVVLNGALLVSRWSLAEVGHMVIDMAAASRGEPCTFEQLASGTALNRRARAIGLPDGRALLAALDGPQAGAAWSEHLNALCVGVRNVAYVFSPERIVIGGGLGRIGARITEPVQAHLAAFGPPALPIEVVSAALGDDAGLIGAAAYPAES